MKFLRTIILLSFLLPSLAGAQEKVSSLPTASTIALYDYLYLVVNGSPFVSKKVPYQVIQQADFAAISGNVTINSSGVSTISNSSVSNAMLLSNIDAAKIADGSVSNTIFQYLANVTSDIQAQINNIITNAITGLTGDVTATGGGSVLATLAIVNSDTGAWGSATMIPTITLDGKGRALSASQNPVIADAGTLTGTTLAPSIIDSSLTSVGTLINLTVLNPINGNITGNAVTVTSMPFNTLTSGINGVAALTVDSGASIVPSGTGIIQATDISNTIVASTNILITGSGTTTSPYSIEATGGSSQWNTDAFGITFPGGNVGIGIASSDVKTLDLQTSLNTGGGGTAYGIAMESEYISAMNHAYGIINNPLLNTSGVINTYTDLWIGGLTDLGAGGSVTVQQGILIDPMTLAAGANNYSIVMQTAATHGWNIYASGTAPNYLNGQTSIYTNTPNASSALQIDSTTQGLTPPRMTTTQKLAIATPIEGLVVYDTTLHKLCYYNGSIWTNL